MAMAQTKLEKTTNSPSTQMHMRMGALIWQESLKVKSDTSQGFMETQSQGINGSVGWLRPLSGRQWLYSYGLDFAIGAIKGKSNTPGIEDEIKGQMWLMGGFTPGLIYRTSPISQVGLMLPLSYRWIEWKLKNGSSFNPDGDTSFSVGLSGVYVNQLTKRSYLYLAVTYQTNWAATIWNMSWQYKLF